MHNVNADQFCEAPTSCKSKEEQTLPRTFTEHVLVWIAAYLLEIKQL
jgi:hypothetical protein